MTYLRGRGDDQALMPWLRETVWPIEGEFASKPEFCRDGTLLACCEMLRGGVTTFADMYLFSESTALAVTKEIGMRAVMGLVMFVFPTAYAGTPEEYHERAEKVLKEFGYVENDVNGNEGVKHESLVTFALAPHAPYTVRSEDWERVGETAKRYNVRVHTHMHETRNEVEASKALNRCDSACHLSDQACTPLEDLHSRNVVSERFIAAHMVHLSESDFDICVSSKMHVIHCPTSNSKLGSGFCAAHKLRAAGVNVGLGTDSACSNNKLDMLSEMRLAALNAKNLTNDATVFPAWQVLEMGTINGAKAFGLEDVTGSIEKGKKADLVVFDVESTPGNSPMFDPAAAVVYAAEREDVRDVMVNGKVLLREKEFVNVDVKDVMKRMTYWKGQIMNKFPMTKKRKGSE